ncbi:hypothetical protein E8E14_008792 [Neopestalotiopsis sp. 37M]|nr:hypothetical protein E8E14_008792 [Neopestalotiopsis sp. 37M]
MVPESSAEAQNPPLVPWHTPNELSSADWAPGMATTPDSADHSSVVGDGGYAKQLAHSTAATHQSSHGTEESLKVEDDLQYMGGGVGLKQPDDHGPVEDQLDAEPELRAAESLERCLRVAMIESAAKEATERLFVPVDEIDRIASLKSVLRELKTLGLGQDQDPNDIAHQICSVHDGISPLDGKATKTNRRRILATLALIEETAAIQDVLREGLYDWDLPLALDRTDPGQYRLARRNADGSLSPVAFSQNWSAYQLEAFSRCQWQLSSPCFEMRTHVGAKIKHYRLNAHSILPITEIDGDDRQGGFSTVSKIKLHPAHRKSMSGNLCPTSWLALKKLRFSTEEAFKAEVGPLKRLGDNENSHIIQLLTTFHHRDEYNLVFEWADGGNLFDFWQAYPQPVHPPRNHGLGKWLTTQLTGLASALSLIHECKLNPQGSNNSGFGSQDGRKKYGAHGDLKPENILWFKAATNAQELCDLGTFKLSDFGLTSFHSLESRKRFLPAGLSATYRAPECDLDRHISQKYDMWSLGCVLLEHLTWYLLGYEGVLSFNQQRMQESQPTFKEDNFFSITQDLSSLQGGGATIKKCVHEQFNVLRSLPNCSDFLSDCIDFVQDKLLRMLPDNRCEVSEFLQFAKDVGQKCVDDDVYCTQRLEPINKRTGTNLSSIHARYSLHPGQLTAIAAMNRSRTSLHKHIVSSTPSGPEPRKPVPTVNEVEPTQSEQEETHPVASESTLTTNEDANFIGESNSDESNEELPTTTSRNENDNGLLRRAIGKVLRDEVFDDKLPLTFDKRSDPVLFFWDSSRKDFKQLECFQDNSGSGWGTQAKLDICKWQWYLRVPRMEVSGPSFKAYTAKFKPNIVLPWCSEVQRGEVSAHDRPDGIGGYSAVYKRHIDPRLHGFHNVLQQVSEGKGCFALKVLKKYTPDEKKLISGLFENERRQLNRFNGVSHNHLVTLLAAFEQENIDENYFIFPWAECDLSVYWENEKPGSVSINWISQQLEGLVGALNEIHNPGENSQNLEPNGRVYGRHGDLKPDNILWYTPYRGESQGILVISDMGFTAVNSELSRSKQTNGKPRTPTYRPPELDIPGAKVAREYDVWPLGCIFLEMMTWLLGGHELINGFKAKRMTPENGVKSSIFFTFVEDKPIVKPEVTEWIATLRSRKGCTEFVHAVLDVVESEMIIPSVEKRSKVHNLKNKFQAINQRCKENEAYYTPDPSTTSTGRSSEDLTIRHK